MNDEVTKQSLESAHSHYWCFISYRHADNKAQDRDWASWLHQEIERYEVPAELIGTESQRGEVIPERIYPVFRDEESLPADADLGNSIVNALDRSHFLVVLCSPRAVKSKYVAQEIYQFKSTGKGDRIIAAILDGEPGNPARECFPETLRHPVREDGSLNTLVEEEPIAADFRLKDGSEGFTSAEAFRFQLTRMNNFPKREIKKRAEAYDGQLQLMKLKIIAGILGVPLETLRDRDKAYQLELARKRANALRCWLTSLSIITFLAVGAGVFAYIKQREATENEHIARHSLSDTDYRLAQASRVRGDYRRATAHLARSLSNDPGHPYSGDLAWAFLTTERLGYSKSMGKIPEDRAATAFSTNGDRLLWVSSTGKVFSQVIEPDAGEQGPKHVVALPEWPDAEEEEYSMSGQVVSSIDASLNHLVIGKYNNDGNLVFFRIAVDTEAIIKTGIVSVDALSDQSGHFYWGPIETRGYGNAYRSVFEKANGLQQQRLEATLGLDSEILAEYSENESVVVTDFAPLISSTYLASRTFDDLVWLHVSSDAKIDYKVVISKTGQLLKIFSSGLSEGIFLPRKDVVLFERITYFGAPVLEWVDLAAPYPANLLRTIYVGEVGDDARFLIAPSQAAIIVAINDRCFFFKDHPDIGIREKHSLSFFKETADLELVGLQGADAIHYDRAKGVIIAACGNELRNVYLPADTRHHTPSVPWNYDHFDLAGAQPPGGFKIADRMAGKPMSDDSRLLSLFSQHEFLDRFLVPEISKFDIEGRNMSVIHISESLSARNAASRICTVDSTHETLINRGYEASHDQLASSRRIAATQLPPTFFWHVFPEDGSIPDWLPDFLFTLADGQFDTNGNFLPIAKPFAANLSPTRSHKFATSWEDVAAAYGYTHKSFSTNADKRIDLEIKSDGPSNETE